MSDLYDAPLDLGALDAALPVSGLGFPLIYEPVIPSTNTRALELVAAGATTGLVVLTDAQPAGRGRQERRWVSMPRRQILLSVALALPFAPHWLVMAASLAACDALELAGARAGIKWPNDVRIGGRKVAGILIETTVTPHAGLMGVMGIGLNVNGAVDDPAIAAQATTVAMEVGHAVAREPIIVALLRSLGAISGRLCGDPAYGDVVRERWRSRLVTLGQPVTVRQGDAAITGVAEDVANDGALLVREADGTLRPVTWGDVDVIGD